MDYCVCVCVGGGGGGGQHTLCQNYCGGGGGGGLAPLAPLFLRLWGYTFQCEECNYLALIGGRGSHPFTASENFAPPFLPTLPQYSEPPPPPPLIFKTLLTQLLRVGSVMLEKINNFSLTYDCICWRIKPSIAEELTGGTLI